MANKGKKKNRSKKKATTHHHNSNNNFDECHYYANLGCHIANVANCTAVEAMKHHPWLLGIEPFDPNDYDPQDLQHMPEVAMNDGDPDDDEYDDCEMSLTLTNVKDTTSILFVTVFDVDLCGANGNILTSGWNYTTTLSNTTSQRKCTTFIVLCPPKTFVHLATLAPNQSIQINNHHSERMPIESWSQIEIESDVQPWSYHHNPNDEHQHLLHFPFHPNDEEVVNDDTNNDPSSAITTNPSSHSYLCSQSENGNLTHFFHGNYHAVDFACPIGTPLYSAVDGIVVEVKDDRKRSSGSAGDNEGEEEDPIIEVSGIAASNLFHWNSIMIQATIDTTDTATNNDPLYIEYVHIQSKSCSVQVGDTVKRGQFLCRSGSVGFSPEPHLHLAAYRSGGVDAATVRVRFQSGEEGEKSFLPRVGQWYDQNGLVKSDLVGK